jgi:hypothetical protein
MKKLFLLFSISILFALFAGGCATGNPAADAFGNWVGGMMIAEAGRPQVTVNNVVPHTHASSPVGAVRFVTDARMDGSSYTGFVKKGVDGIERPDGKGKRTYEHGLVLEGEFKDGFIHGPGVAIKPGIGRWEAERWKDGKPSGRGSFTSAAGAEYQVKFEGEFEDGAWHGRGVLTGHDGTKTEAEWRRGKIYGQARVTKPSGTDLTVDYLDDKRLKEEGTTVYPDGTKQVGKWDYARGTGSGVINWKDGREYNGEWRNVEGKVDQPDGEGTMTWPNGNKYKGEWKDGKMHGFGKMTLANGTVQEGVWRADKFVSAQPAPSVSPVPSGGKQGSVSVISNEEDAEVLVDGSFVGNAPAKLKLTEGAHVIEVKKDGFKPFKREIKVTEGSELNLRAVLQRQ